MSGACILMLFFDDRGQGFFHGVGAQWGGLCHVWYVGDDFVEHARL